MKEKKTNFDKVKKSLCPNAVDAAYLLNTLLTTREKRKAAAAQLKETSPCAFCWKHHAAGALSDEDCPNYRSPLNICRANIIRWLELPAGTKPPKAWVKED